MMEWLLAAPTSCSFEVSGGDVLCSMERLDPERVEAIIETLLGFADRIPRVVASLHPGIVDTGGSSGSVGTAGDKGNPQTTEPQ